MVRKRNVPLTSSPLVTAGNIFNQNITVEVRGFTGETLNTCTGELSLDCCANLIRKLRRALLETSRDIQAHAARAVQNAEGPL